MFILSPLYKTPKAHKTNNKKMKIALGDKILELIYPSVADGAATIVVRVPESKFFLLLIYLSIVNLFQLSSKKIQTR